MKYITLFLLFITSFAFSQVSYVSVDNKKEAWEVNSTWIKSPNENWVANNPGTALNWSSVTINGTVTRTGDLTVQGATTLYISDTLVITANLNMIAGGKIVVNNGGVLIVKGNIDMSGGMKITSTGTGRIVTVGEFKMSNGTVTIDNQFYSFDTTPTFSGGPKINGTQYSSNPAPNGNTAVLAAYLSTKSDLQTQDPTLYAYVMGTVMGIDPPVPIVLVSFTVTLIDDKPVLAWVTAMEKNNDYFTILRSDNAKDFQSIGTVNGNGNSNHAIKYSWTDHSNLSGIVYYRIMQTDFDGQNEAFKIVAISLNWTLVEGYKISDDETVLSVVYYDLSGRMVDNSYSGVKILNIVTSKKRYIHKII